MQPTPAPSPGTSRCACGAEGRHRHRRRRFGCRCQPRPAPCFLANARQAAAATTLIRAPPPPHAGSTVSEGLAWWKDTEICPSDTTTAATPHTSSAPGVASTALARTPGNSSLESQRRPPRRRGNTGPQRCSQAREKRPNAVARPHTRNHELRTHMGTRCQASHRTDVMMLEKVAHTLPCHADTSDGAITNVVRTTDKGYEQDGDTKTRKHIHAQRITDRQSKARRAPIHKQMLPSPPH